MPRVRKGPVRSLLPDREQAICARFREVREKYRFKQDAFGNIFGITADRVRSYEYARAPIRYGLGAKLCEELDVSQSWLATGEGAMRPSMNIASGYSFFIPTRMLFSEVYDKLLSELLAAEICLFKDTFGYDEKFTQALLPVGGDWSSSVRVIADILHQAFVENASKLSSDTIENVVWYLETQLGPFTVEAKNKIQYALKSRENREIKSGLEEIKDVVFFRLGINQEILRSMNSEDADAQHEDAKAFHSAWKARQK